MDPHDKEFETFLRQFRLRMPGPIKETVSRRRRSAFHLALAAAAIVIVSFTAVMFRNHSGINAPAATVTESGEPSLYKAGEQIAAGKVVQSNSAKGLTLALNDGSSVEMRSQSELKLESAADGLRIRLNDGSIVVTAAKQASGHLYVQTKDASVSVVGTVFLVHAEPSGTRVAVVEGEVHVLQGTESKRLLPGEQAATNSSIVLKPIAEEISWSRSASEYFVLLPHTATEAEVAQTGGAPDVKEIGLLPPIATGLATGVLPFKVEANYVKLTSDSIRTLITIEIMTRDLAFRPENGGQLASAHITGVVYRADNRRMSGSSFSQDITVPFTSEKALKAGLDRPNLYQVTTYLAPGKYKLHLTVEDKNSQSIKTDDVLLSPPRIPDQVLQASSMILAYSVTDIPPKSVGTEMFVLGDKKVKPNISAIFRPEESLNVWQEIYGLAADQTTHKPSANIELLILQNKQEIKKLISGLSEFPGTGPQVTYTNSVSLAEFAPGQYEVQIKVTDNLSKQSLVSTRNFAVIAITAKQEQVPPRPSQPVSPADSPGRSIFYRACTTCHNAEVTINKPLSTRAEYANLVSRQLNYGASVSSVEVPVLVDYLFETFGNKPGPPAPSDIPLQKQ